MERFVAGYGPADRGRIRCTVSPYETSGGPVRVGEKGRPSDENAAFRSRLLAHLYEDPNAAGNAGSAAGDELLADLFLSSWTCAVVYNSCGSVALARELLERGLVDAFARAYSLPLGMDQGLPLEEAMIGAAGTRGVPVPRVHAEVLESIEANLATESRPEARGCYERWRERFRRPG